MIHISGRTYNLIHENRNGWNFEAFRERYSEVLERYDYVFGDWGYNQLRLKGFFRDNHPKATRDTTFSSMTDYINEYCNFGCAYFVLERLPGGSRSGEDGELNDDHDGEAYETPDGVDAYVTASRAVAAGQASEAPAAEHQQVKFMPRHERDQRREQQRSNNRKEAAAKEAEREHAREGRKPQGKEHGKPGRQQHERPERGERHDRGERNERPERGERHDRGERNERPERGERHDRGERHERPERGERNERGGEHRADRERSERPERNRNKRNQHFNQKAPVAATSEHPNPQQQQQRHKENKQH
ncbi:YutD-like domain-containing protein [Paenibacillus silvisoli]|uniref:YutD-like domain-containing protein n=1 Tax=Paenibacillus silvisoli TaxID=3110539 RepID=UPI0028049F73|nr:YutD-like domain-containing protein [Paenibacillus silvisoli]